MIVHIPHSFFWRYIPEDKLENPMHYLREMVMPTASDLIGQRSTVITLIHQVAEKLK